MASSSVAAAALLPSVGIATGAMVMASNAVAYSLSQVEPQHGQRAYALRPELVESTYYLYLATRDPAYLGVGREMLAAIQSRCR